MMPRPLKLALLAILLVPIALLNVGTAQSVARLFGTTSSGQPAAVRVDANGAMLVTATGSSAGQFPTVLSANVTAVCTANNTTETDLWTYTVPANTLTADAQALRLTVWGTYAATANNKTLTFYYAGSSTSLATGPQAINNGQWEFRVDIFRTGSSAQYVFGTAMHGQASSNNQTHKGHNFTGAASMASTLALKVTGTNGTAAANDICFRGALVQVLR